MNCGGLLSLTEQFRGGTGDAKGCTMSLPPPPQGRHLQLKEVSQPWFHRRWGIDLLMLLAAMQLLPLPPWLLLILGYV